MKQFAIFKNTKKEKDSQPDYKLSAKVNDKYIEIGAGWIKEGKSGKFISVKLSDTFQDRKGYSLEEDKVSTLSEVDKEFIKKAKDSAGFTPEEIDF